MMYYGAANCGCKMSDIPLHFSSFVFAFDLTWLLFWHCDRLSSMQTVHAYLPWRISRWTHCSRFKLCNACSEFNPLILHSRKLKHITYIRFLTRSKLFSYKEWKYFVYYFTISNSQFYCCNYIKNVLVYTFVTKLVSMWCIET